MHISWFRFHAGSVPGTQFPVSSIMYRTLDTKSGALGPVENVTSSSAPNADWVPSIALVGGTPVIAFASPTRRTKNGVWTIF